MNKSIEELTLKEIRELKSQLADKLSLAVMDVIAKFTSEHGLHPKVRISAERPPVLTETGEVVMYHCKAEVDVEFEGEQL